MKSHLSPKLTEFLFEHIDSVHTLDVLLLLWETPQQKWKLTQVHGRIKSSLTAVELSLRTLVLTGLVSRLTVDEFCYFPKSAVLADCATELLKNYLERSSAVIEVIYSKPTRPVRDLSDAVSFESEAENS